MPLNQMQQGGVCEIQVERIGLLNRLDDVLSREINDNDRPMKNLDKLPGDNQRILAVDLRKDGLPQTGRHLPKAIKFCIDEMTGRSSLQARSASEGFSVRPQGFVPPLAGASGLYSALSQCQATHIPLVLFGDDPNAFETPKIGLHVEPSQQTYFVRSVVGRTNRVVKSSTRPD